MNPELWDIWIFDRDRLVLLTDVPGVPLKVVVASDGTLGGTFFDGGCWISFLGDFDDARRIAQIAAQVRGYLCKVETLAGLEDDEEMEDIEERMELEDDYSPEEPVPGEFEQDPR